MEKHFEKRDSLYNYRVVLEIRKMPFDITVSVPLTHTCSARDYRVLILDSCQELS